MQGDWKRKGKGNCKFQKVTPGKWKWIKEECSVGVCEAWREFQQRKGCPWEEILILWGGIGFSLEGKLDSCWYDPLSEYQE